MRESHSAVGSRDFDRRRRSIRDLALAFLLIGLPMPLQAHAILVGSQPGDGATVTGPEVSVDLHFNSRIDGRRSTLMLTAADGDPARLPLDDGAAADELRATATLPPGGYRLRWQVLSVDGHLTRGDLHFTVVAP